MPKLSIITINYDNLAGLQKTMQSVFEQSFNDYEYIVIDGGSTDGSKNLIEHSASRLSYWVSEKDKGIYDAMNKGISYSKGEYLLFLNSGDYLYNQEVLTSLCNEKYSEEIIYGNIKWQTDGVLSDGIFPSLLNLEYFSEASLPHQASFIKRELFTMLGKYQLEFTITADWAFFIKAICRFNFNYRHVPMFISVCDRHGISCRPESWPLILSERRKYINRHFPEFYGAMSKQNNKSIIYSIKSKLRGIYSKLVNDTNK